MIIRIATVLSLFVFLSACLETPRPTVTTATPQVALPSPIVMVGEAAAGAVFANELMGDGLLVATAFNGRAAGITTYCSGNADILALAPGQGLTSTERQRCKDLNGSWSAFSTQKGTVVYVQFEIAEDLLEKAVTSFSG